MKARFKLLTSGVRSDRITTVVLRLLPSLIQLAIAFATM